MPDAVRVGLVYPDVLGTYGDGGNAVVLAQRLRWRGIAAEIVRIPLDSPVPSGCDIYVLGGGEDAPQTLAADALRRSGTLGTAVAGGAVVLAVCAGLQVIGTRFLAGGGVVRDGVGLVDLETIRALDRRAVGELVVEPRVSGALLPALTGYENHAGRTVLGPGVVALGGVRTGVGNGAAGVDGVVSGRVLGTYLHGPVLARNPGLADLLLSWIVGGPLPEGDARLAQADQAADALRAERLAAVAGAGGGTSPRRWWRLRA